MSIPFYVQKNTPFFLFKIVTLFLGKKTYKNSMQKKSKDCMFDLYNKKQQGSQNAKNKKEKKVFSLPYP